MNHPTNFSDATAAATQSPPGPWSPARKGFTAALVLAALWLGWKAWDVNTTMSCWKREWPQLALCEDANGRTLEEKVARLEQRLARNPGDTVALVALTVYAHRPDAPPHLDPAALLARARAVAPQQGDVLRLQAHGAMQAQRWTEALDALVRLSQYHGDAEATRTLAGLVNYARVNGEVGTALVAAAKADTGWLDRVLRALPAAQVPTVVAMPLIQQLVEHKTLTPKLGLELIRQLKAEGQWLDAHALWMQLWNKPLPMLFNGDFEQPFVAGGFDWETPGGNDHRAGAQVSLSGRKGRGQVLRVEFRGKALSTPVVRQILMLPPGRYRLTGEYQSTELRSEQGLAWVFSCAGSRGEIARAPSLRTTGRDWQRIDLALQVPPECGFGVSLGLQPQADFEARTGMRGEMLFDNFQLSMETQP